MVPVVVWLLRCAAVAAAKALLTLVGDVEPIIYNTSDISDITHDNMSRDHRALMWHKLMQFNVTKGVKEVFTTHLLALSHLRISRHYTMLNVWLNAAVSRHELCKDKN